MTYFPHVWSVFYEQQPGQARARAPSETGSTAGLQGVKQVDRREEKLQIK